MSRNDRRGLMQRLLARIWLPRTATLDGIIVPLSELPLAVRLKRRIASGKYETHERRLLKDFLSPGDRVLELGASIGILSSIVRARIGTQGRLIAVEANHKLSAPFHKQMSANGFECELITCVCTPTWGSSTGGAQYGRFSTEGNNLVGRLVERSNGVQEQPVLRSAGEICRELGFDPNAVICDIEGAECAWATEAMTIPGGVEKILVEFHPWLDGCVRAGKALAELCRVGFEVHAFSGTVFDLRRVSSLPTRLPEGPPAPFNGIE